MPTKAAYPTDWLAFSKHIRFVRAEGRCECSGQCGLHNRTGGPRRCEERHGEPAKWANGKVVLTTAHLCSCEPLCAEPSHVIAACNRCHLRIDAKLHTMNAATTRQKKQEAAGQRRLLEGGPRGENA